MYVMLMDKPKKAFPVLMSMSTSFVSEMYSNQRQAESRHKRMILGGSEVAGIGLGEVASEESSVVVSGTKVVVSGTKVVVSGSIVVSESELVVVSG